MNNLVVNLINRSIEVTNEALSVLSQFKPNLFSFEQGGVLLGEIFENKVVITKVVTPSELDRKGSFFFIRSKKYAQNIINEHWVKSKGKINYIGEWHTHNEFNPSPSRQDDKTMKKIVSKTSMEISFLLLMIKGKSSNLWIGEYGKLGLSDYKLIN